MLIEFSVANFKSIKEEACLNMTAGPGREHRKIHLVVPTLTARSQPSPLVRTAVIFGANAAGKSNLLDALRVMKNIVRTSSQGPAELPVIPFKFDFDSKNQSTVFEVKCIVQGIRFINMVLVSPRTGCMTNGSLPGRGEECKPGLNATVPTGNWETS